MGHVHWIIKHQSYNLWRPTLLLWPFQKIKWSECHLTLEPHLPSTQECLDLLFFILLCIFIVMGVFLLSKELASKQWSTCTFIFVGRVGYVRKVPIYIELRIWGQVKFVFKVTEHHSSSGIKDVEMNINNNETQLRSLTINREAFPWQSQW